MIVDERKTLMHRLQSGRWQVSLRLLFYVIYVFLFNLYYLRTTMFWNWCLKDYQPALIMVSDRMTICLFVLAVVNFLFSYEGIRERLLFIMLFVPSVYLFTADYSKFYAIIACFLLILCSKNISFRLIGWISVYCGSAWMLSSAIACHLGYLPDVINHGRHSFGSIYFTDLFCHILVLFMTLCILRNGRLKLFEYFAAAVLVGINLKYMQAKVGLVCMFVLLFGTLFYQYIRPRMHINVPFLKSVMKFFICAFVIIAAVMTAITLSYSTDPGNWYNKYDFFHTLEMRFRYGYQAFQNYKILPFGQVVTEYANGENLEGGPTNYYFLDISYIRLLFIYGWVTLLIAMLLYTQLQVKLYKKGWFYLMFVVAVFALDCGVEHHMIDLTYCILPYLMLARFEPVHIETRE